MSIQKPTNSVLDLIGNTPLLEVMNIDTGPCKLFLKLESQNPGGSIKDRPAKYMIEDAEKSGKLTKGGLIIEATAGNTGIGLALIGLLRGYKCLIVVPDKMAKEKIIHLEALGAEAIITRSDVEKGHPEYYADLAHSIAEKHKGSLYINQFGNQANLNAHFEWLVEGIGEDYIPPLLDFELITHAYAISDKEALDTCHLILKKEGVLSGSSSGTLISAALKYCREQTEPKNVVTLVCDTGNKYLKIYDKKWLVENKYN